MSSFVLRQDQLLIQNIFFIYDLIIRISWRFHSSNLFLISTICTNLVLIHQICAELIFNHNLAEMSRCRMELIFEVVSYTDDTDWMITLSIKLRWDVVYNWIFCPMWQKIVITEPYPVSANSPDREAIIHLPLSCKANQHASWPLITGQCFFFILQDNNMILDHSDGRQQREQITTPSGDKFGKWCFVDFLKQHF